MRSDRRLFDKKKFKDLCKVNIWTSKRLEKILAFVNHVQELQDGEQSQTLQIESILKCLSATSNKLNHLTGDNPIHYRSASYEPIQIGDVEADRKPHDYKFHVPMRRNFKTELDCCIRFLKRSLITAKPPELSCHQWLNWNLAPYFIGRKRWDWFAWFLSETTNFRRKADALRVEYARLEKICPPRDREIAIDLKDYKRHRRRSHVKTDPGNAFLRFKLAIKRSKNEAIKEEKR
jgi:hypothetical protein